MTKAYLVSNALLDKYIIDAPGDAVILSINAAVGSYLSAQGSYVYPEAWPRRGHGECPEQFGGQMLYRRDTGAQIATARADYGEKVYPRHGYKHTS
jgi:hypothetical protein